LGRMFPGLLLYKLKLTAMFCSAVQLIPRLHDEAGSTSSSSARRASSSSQLHRVNGVLDTKNQTQLALLPFSQLSAAVVSRKANDGVVDAI